MNAAGIETFQKDSLDTMLWKETFATKLFAAVECIRRTIPRMKSGVIINVSAITGSERIVFETTGLAYEASKAALHKVTESIAVTRCPSICAVTVSPGYTNTPIWDKFSDEMKQDSFRQGVDPALY